VGLPLLFRGVDAASARPRVAESIARIGLTGFERYHPCQLSAGMRKRVALAMTMVYEPEIVLMDERRAGRADRLDGGGDRSPKSVYDNRFVLKALGR
jgi:energy-coupling factor transporter ATP-binding protein EcfA2